MASIDILALGEPLIEMVRLPETKDGRTLYQRGVGGDTLNAMVAASRQGGSAGLITAVGGDPFGQDILRFCARERIDTSGVRVCEKDPTGVAFINPDPQNRSFSYARRGSAASMFGPDDLPEDLIAGAKVLHVTAISQAISPSMRTAVQRAAEIANSHATLVSYDTNLRLNLWSLEEAQACIEAFLPFADIVLPSDDEAALIAGTKDPTRMISYFRRHDPLCVVLKRSSNGAILADQSGTHTIKSPSVDAVDSTGAGDSFAGAFLCHYVGTGSTLKAAELAAKVAAQTVTGFGATDAIPYR